MPNFEACTPSAHPEESPEWFRRAWLSLPVQERHELARAHIRQYPGSPEARAVAAKEYLLLIHDAQQLLTSEVTVDYITNYEQILPQIGGEPTPDAT